MTSGESEEESPSYETTQELNDDIQILTHAHEEAGREARYRDQLMHNSYYLVVIALVFAVGNLLTLFTARQIVYPPEFVVGILFALFGLAIFGIGIVMLTYNEKRNNANRLRGNLSRRLGEKLESTDGDSFNFNRQILAGEARENHPDNQVDQVSKKLEWFFRRRLSASRLALVLLVFGSITAVLGVLSLVIGVWSILF